MLEEAGLPAGEELILRRINTPEGRKTAWVNDRRASGEVLRALSDTLVELHGQQDDAGCSTRSSTARCSMPFGGHGALSGRGPGRWASRRAAAKALETAEARLAEMRAEEDYLRHAVAELDALDPQPGEEETLDTRRRLMQGAERMRADVARAVAALGSTGPRARWATRGAGSTAWRPRGGWARPGAGGAGTRAGGPWTEAQTGVARFAETLAFNPPIWKRPRSGCSPCAVWRASIPRRARRPGGAGQRRCVRTSQRWTAARARSRR